VGFEAAETARSLSSEWPEQGAAFSMPPDSDIELVATRTAEFRCTRAVDP